MCCGSMVKSNTTRCHLQGLQGGKSVEQPGGQGGEVVVVKVSMKRRRKIRNKHNMANVGECVRRTVDQAVAVIQKPLVNAFTINLLVWWVMCVSITGTLHLNLNKVLPSAIVSTSRGHGCFSFTPPASAPFFTAHMVQHSHC